MEAFLLILSKPIAREAFIFLMRVWFGSMMMFHGSSKLLSRMDIFIGHLSSSGLPLPEFLGYAVVFGQLIGGLALIFGLLARPAALLLSFTTFGAVLEVFIFSIYAPFGRKGELALLYFILAGLLLLVGPGKYSIDDYLYRRQQDKKADKLNRQAAQRTDESLSWDKINQ